jgi:hypothetical protein
MNYQAFTNDSLTTMYEVVRGALDADDTLSAPGEEIRFRVRETPDWKKHAADLEMEMIRRGMIFELIDWSKDQAQLPLWDGRSASRYLHAAARMTILSASSGSGRCNDFASSQGARIQTSCSSCVVRKP